MSEESSSIKGENSRLPLLPLGVSLSSLEGLLEALYYNFNKRGDIYELAYEYELDIDELMPIIEAAKLLKFVQLKDGDIELTKLGEVYVKSGRKGRKKILQKSLKNIEPFRTALELIKEKGEFDIEEIYEKLIEKKYGELEAPEMINKLNETLINWGLYALLYEYSGDEEIFEEQEAEFN